MQSGKQDVFEVVSPNECGLKVNVGQKIETGDILHIYQEEHLEQKIELKKCAEFVVLIGMISI